jgi:Uma2 family endonuclease
MSTAVATKARYTPEDLLDLPDSKSYELVRGQLVERSMGVESSWIASQLIVRLGRFCEDQQIGWVLQADCGYQCFPHDPGMVRKADVSFIRRGRFPGDILPKKGWARIAPDLAIEVVSPNDRAVVLDEKLADYHKAGVPLVWVIYSESCSVMVYRRDGSISRLLEEDELSGEDVVPGFRCKIREILPPQRRPEEAQPAATAPNGPQ